MKRKKKGAVYEEKGSPRRKCAEELNRLGSRL